jgi:hypothetical protein
LEKKMPPISLAAKKIIGRCHLKGKIGKSKIKRRKKTKKKEEKRKSDSNRIKYMQNCGQTKGAQGENTDLLSQVEK